MASTQQIVKELKSSLSSFDLSSAIERSDNEAKTRMYLVEPFFEALLYNRGFDNGCLVPEFDADFGELKGRKVDYAILFKNKPEIIIEVKKCSLKLSDLHLRQLNEYFIYTTDAKIGVLTNGIEFHFYCRNEGKGQGLHPTPFYSFSWDNIDGSTLEQLAGFYATQIDTKQIIQNAQDLFFLEGFEEALFNELSNPSREFIKSIYANMGGSRLNENTEKQIKELVNSVSLKSALNKLIVEESKSANSGIVTTDEELKAYHVIKTMLAQHKKIETSAVGYRDYKGKFSIILDDNQKKKVCDLYITPNHQKIEIDGEKYDISDIDSIVKHKKKLTDVALSLL